LAGGCKYFKKQSAKPVEVVEVDTNQNNAVDSTAYYDDGANTATAPSNTNKAAAVSGKYYMIVGCFTVSENADRYAEKLRGMGYASEILTGIGNFQMVAAASYNNYRESVDAISKFRNEVTPNAWVYLKR
jgi:cell division septation protein DedD